MEDLDDELENPRLRAILAPAVYHPTAERLAQICRRYRAEPRWRMLGCRHGEQIVGCLGLALGDSGHAIIRHIAVASDRRGQGIGTAMIRHAVATFALTHLRAETDRDAVEFYRRCGFTIQNLGELYPGTERFLCTYTTPVEGDDAAQSVPG
jgi:GNAT superfamily N-acetyltransferase